MASKFEIGPVKIENQEVRLAFGFYQTFYHILLGASKFRQFTGPTGQQV
jgi:hypothetical protein